MESQSVGMVFLRVYPETLTLPLAPAARGREGTIGAATRPLAYIPDTL